MKSLIVYYSHSGNTAYVCERLYEALKKKGEADIFELQYSRGRINPLSRIFFRFFPAAVKLIPVPADLKDYDVLCLGIPVVAGRPAAAITKYMQTCKNMQNKKVICCLVFGFELSAKRCFNYVQSFLKRRGHPEIISLFAPWLKVHNEVVLDQLINEAIDKLTPNPPSVTT